MNLAKNLAKQDSRNLLSIVLLAQSLLAYLLLPQTLTLIHFSVSVSVSLLADWLLNRLRFGRFLWPKSGLITGLILFLIIDTSTPVAITSLLSLLAIASKLIRFQNKHIFNPATLALFLASIIFDLPVSWWGIAGTQITVLLIIILTLPILIKLKRLIMPIIFLFIYHLYLLLISPNGLALSTLLDPTAVFFAFIILTERITSPGHRHWRYSFGALVGLLLIFILRFAPHVPDPLLSSLLTANLLYTFSSLLQSKKGQESGQEIPEEIHRLQT